MSLLPDVPSVVCRCGRIYFDGESDKLWACARKHVEERKARERAQQQMDALTKWESPRRAA